MPKSHYVKKAIILTVTGLILRAAGMFLRVYIAKRIDTQGMGVYQLLQTAYMMFVTVCTAGLNITATRLTADALALHNTQAVQGVLRRLLLLACISGLTCAAVLLCGAPFVAGTVLHEARIAPALRVLAAGLPFMALSAVLRGYFMAHQNIRPNTWAQLVEQAVRISLVMLLLTRVQTQAVDVVCTLIALGTAISEGVSWLLMLAFFLVGRARGGSVKPAPPPKVFNVLGPVAGSQILSGTLRTVENILVPAKLTVFTQNREAALSQFGVLKGMALPVMFFPFSFLSPLTTLLMPQIAVAHVQKNTAALQQLVHKTLVITGAFSCMMGGAFFVFANTVSFLLYGDGDAALYLCALAPLTPFMYLESMADGILKGIDEQKACFRYRTVDALLRIAAILCLLPGYGMRGFLGMMYASNLFTFVLHTVRLVRKAHVRFPLKSSLLAPLGAAVVACAGTGLFIKNVTGTQALRLPQALLGGAVYVLAFLLFLAVCNHEIFTYLPKRRQKQPPATPINEKNRGIFGVFSR